MRPISILIAVVLAAIPAAASAEGIEEKAQICAACHGEAGVPLEQPFPVPVIWGQNLGYLFFQLRDFKTGARKNDVMTPIVEALEHDDLMPLAQYFAKKPWPKLPQQQPPAELATEAQRISTSAVCTSCHYQGFLGDSTQPRLAGQDRAYLQKTMADFGSGARSNNPSMAGFVKGLAEHEIRVMAAWLAGL